MSKTITDTFRRLMWPTGTLVLLGLVLLTGLGLWAGGCFNKKKQQEFTNRYEALNPGFVTERWSKVRYFTIDPAVPKRVRELGAGDFSSGLAWGLNAIWNEPLKSHWNIGDRFKPLPKDGHLPKDGTLIHVKLWTRDHCLESNTNIHFADLAQDKEGNFMVRLCVDKAVGIATSGGSGPLRTSKTARILKNWWHGDTPFLPDITRKMFWGCIMAHEMGHSYMHSHIDGNGLMADGLAVCRLSQHELAIFKNSILPHILLPLQFSK